MAVLGADGVGAGGRRWRGGRGVAVGLADFVAVGFLVPEALGLREGCFVAEPDGLADADGLGVAVAVAHVAEVCEPGHDVAGVLEVAGADAVADLAGVKSGRSASLTLARLVDVVELDAGDVGLDAAVDRDRVAVGGDVVLVLGPR